MVKYASMTHEEFFNEQMKDPEFAKAYEKAIKELEKDGTLAKLSEKYFGEDVFSYVDKDQLLLSAAHGKQKAD